MHEMCPLDASKRVVTSREVGTQPPPPDTAVDSQNREMGRTSATLVQHSRYDEKLLPAVYVPSL